MMQRNKIRLTICCALLLLTVCTIWGNSLLSGDTSGSISGGLSAWLGKIFPIFSPDSPNGHYLLRKCAHFSIFCLLGMELSWFFGMVRKNGVILCCMAVSAAVAAIDETIQRFVPDRYGCFSDVMIDFSGASFGIAFLFLGYAIMQRKKLKQERSL